MDGDVFGNAGGGGGADGGAVALEVRSFSCDTAFAYVVPPARTAAGHRAADWDVDKWLCKVTCTLATLSGDAVPDGTAVVRLHDAATGELFAESPLAADVPLQAVVEPVVDSSRYFVLRVQDAASGRHAFVGLGFASRDHSTDFKMALSELQTARDRDKEAQRRRAAHEAAQQAAVEQQQYQPEGAEQAGGQLPSGSGEQASPRPRSDMALPEGTKIVLNVPVRHVCARAPSAVPLNAHMMSTLSFGCPPRLRRAWPSARPQAQAARCQQWVACCRHRPGQRRRLPRSLFCWPHRRRHSLAAALRTTSATLNSADGLNCACAPLQWRFVLHVWYMKSSRAPCHCTTQHPPPPPAAGGALLSAFPVAEPFTCAAAPVALTGASGPPLVGVTRTSSGGLAGEASGLPACFDKRSFRASSCFFMASIWAACASRSANCAPLGEPLGEPP